MWLVQENGINKIKIQFYKKAVSSKIYIGKESVLSWICNKSAVAGEVFRRLYNCSGDVREEKGHQLVREFCNDLKNSG